jgi:hypothetical protein
MNRLRISSDGSYVPQSTNRLSTEASDRDIPLANIRISRQVRRGILGNPVLMKVLNWLRFVRFAAGTETSWSEIYRATIPEAKRLTY